MSQTPYTLIIGNKNYSSWSLRPWLALSAAGIPFRERVLPIGTELFRREMAGIAAGGRVPVLLDGADAVWESLAIIEHVAERHPDRGLWPQDPAARALARSLAAEMHVGFSQLRRDWPMNLWRPPEARPLSPRGAEDLARLTALWTRARTRFGAGGDFLFGPFSAADAMFAPVATRLRTYVADLDPVSAAYVAAIHAQPDFVRWREAALREDWVLQADEVDWPAVKRIG